MTVLLAVGAYMAARQWLSAPPTLRVASAPAGEDDPWLEPETSPAPDASGMAAADWPMFHGDSALTGGSAAALPSAVAIRWRFKTGEAIKSSPAVSGGKVYVGSNDGFVYAVDQSSGKKVWAFKAEDAVQSSPLVLDGVVYVGSDDRNVYALDAATGDLRWKFKAGDRIFGAINCARLDGALAGATASQPTTSAATSRGSPATSGPAAAGTTVILFGSYDSTLYCLRADNGESVWESRAGSYINGAPAVGGGRVVFGSCDNALHVLDLADGSEIQRVPTESYIAGSPAIVGDAAWFGDYGGVVRKVDLATGRVKWSLDTESMIAGSPAVGGPSAGAVVVGTGEGKLYAIDPASGKKAWTFTTDTEGGIESSPAISARQGLVVFGSSDGKLYCVRLSDGKKVWSYELGSGIASSPAVFQLRPGALGSIVVGCDDGVLYCLEPAARPRAKAR